MQYPIHNTVAILTFVLFLVLFLPSYRQHSSYKGLQAALKQLVGDSNAAGVLDGGQRVLDDIFNVEVGPDLMQVLAQVDHLGVGEHDEFHTRRRLVVVELVFAGAVREEGIVGAAELGDKVAEREDEAKDELLVVRVRHALAHGGDDIAVACNRVARLREGGSLGRRRRG